MPDVNLSVETFSGLDFVISYGGKSTEEFNGNLYFLLGTPIRCCYL
jgi:hypothetical protein